MHQIPLENHFFGWAKPKIVLRLRRKIVQLRHFSFSPPPFAWPIYAPVWMFRCRLGEVPNDLGIQFRLSGRLGIQAVIPPLSRNRSGSAQAKYDESFAFFGLRLWNVLPAEISMMDCPRTFKRVLTEWCLKRPDRPPVAGYWRLDDNSLLSVSQLSV